MMEQKLNNIEREKKNGVKCLKFNKEIFFILSSLNLKKRKQSHKLNFNHFNRFEP